MKTRLVGAALLAVIAASSAAQDQKPPVAPPAPARAAESSVTPEAKAALAKMNAAIDRPVAKGLRSMTGIVEVTSANGPVTVDVSFAAPATFKAEASGRKEGLALGMLKAAMNGVGPADDEPIDVETTRKDGHDILVLTSHGTAGWSSRSEYTLDADGLPVSGLHTRTHVVGGVERVDNSTVSFVWSKIGETHRLAKMEMTIGATTTMSTTLAYEEFDGIPIATSWKTEVVAGQRQAFDYRFTELTLNGKKVEIKSAKEAPSARGEATDVPVATPDVEAKAIKILETYRDATSFEEPDPRQKDLVALGRPALDAFLRVLSDPAFKDQWAMREAASRALAQLVIDDDVPKLSRLMREGHRGVEVAFAKLNAPETIAAYAGLLRDGCFGGRLHDAARPHLRDPAVVAACCAWLANPKYDGDLDFAIAKMAELVGGTGANRVQDDPSDDVSRRTNSHQPLAETMPEAKPALESLLARPLRLDARRNVAAALIRIGDKAGIPVLIEVLGTTVAAEKPFLGAYQLHAAGKQLNGVSGTHIYVGSEVDDERSGETTWEGNFADAAKRYREWWTESKDKLSFDAATQKWSVK